MDSQAMTPNLLQLKQAMRDTWVPEKIYDATRFEHGFM